MNESALVRILSTEGRGVRKKVRRGGFHRVQGCTGNRVSQGTGVHRVQGFTGSRFSRGTGSHGFRVSGFEFRVSNFGFRVPGFEFRVSGLGFRVSGFGFRVSGFGFRVQGSGLRMQGSPPPDARPSRLLHSAPHTEQGCGTSCLAWLWHVLPLPSPGR